MFEAYKIGIKLSLINNVSSGLSVVSSSFHASHKEALAFQKTLDGIKLTAKQGMYLFGTGAAMASPFVFAISKAAELQKQLIGIQLATRGTTSEMLAMRKNIEQTSAQTIFSNIDVAKMAKLITTGTGFTAKETSENLPIYAKFADVQQLMKGTGYEESTKLAIRMAHTAQHYDPASLSKYMDLLTKASMIIPGSLSEIGRALSYSQGIAKTALGINDNDIVLMTSLLNRMGFAGHGGSRAGTNLIAALSRTIPGVFGSGLLKGKSAEALKAMGMTDEKGHSTLFTNGKFDMFKWIGRLGEYVNSEYSRNPEAIARQNIMKNFKWASGEQGSRVASMFSTPQALQQLQQIGKSFSGMGGVESMQKTFADEATAQKWINAKTNFISAMTEIGMTLLPTVNVGLTAFNKGMQVLVPWLTENQGLVKSVAFAFLSLSGYLMFSGSLFMLAAGFKVVAASTQILTAANGASSIPKLMTALGKGGLALTLFSLIPIAYEASKAMGFVAESLFDLLHNKDGSTNSILTYIADHAMGLDTKMKWLPTSDSKGTQSPADFRNAFGNPNYVQVGNKGKTIQVQSDLHVDGHKLATVMTTHQTNQMERAMIGGIGYFDPSLSLAPAGF